MVATVNVHEAKTHLSRLLERAHAIRSIGCWPPKVAWNRYHW